MFDIFGRMRPGFYSEGLIRRERNVVASGAGDRRARIAYRHSRAAWPIYAGELLPCCPKLYSIRHKGEWRLSSLSRSKKPPHLF